MADKIPYSVVDEDSADEAFTEPRVSSRWSEVMRVLLNGESIFIPNMSRLDLESLRNGLRYRTNRVLKSRTTSLKGKTGKLLRLTGVRRSK